MERPPIMAVYLDGKQVPGFLRGLNLTDLPIVVDRGQGAFCLLGTTQPRSVIDQLGKLCGSGRYAFWSGPGCKLEWQEVSAKGKK